MADLNTISYGFTPGDTPLGAAMAGQEDAYQKQARAVQLQLQIEKAARDNAAQQAQQHYWESTAANTAAATQERLQAARDAATQKIANAQRMKIEDQRPVVQAVADQGYDAVTNTNPSPNKMMDLYTAAERYNQLENNLPDSVKQVLSKSATYKNPATGETLQSNYDPILFKKIADSWATDKNTTTQNVANTRANAAITVGQGHDQTSLQVAQINKQARLEATKAAASGKKDTLSSMLANAEQRYMQSNDPEDLATVQHIASLMQSTKPTPMATTILPSGGIGPAPTAAPTVVPPLVKPNSAPQTNSQFNPQQQDWITRAQQHNPGMSLDDIIIQGKKLGKL